MLREVKYFPPSRGFPAQYFPYLMQEDYLNPLVAVQFHPRWPQANGQLIHIECRAWAKNIGYSRRDKIGIASLELRILNEESAKVSDKSEL
jgi:sodium/potassium-transporting ATPase subunit beta